VDLEADPAAATAGMYESGDGYGCESPGTVAASMVQCADGELSTGGTVREKKLKRRVSFNTTTKGALEREKQASERHRFSREHIRAALGGDVHMVWAWKK
jgi:hypothetical protein